MCLEHARHLILIKHGLLFLRTYVQMNAFYFSPLWMASVIPPDMILILLEGITAIIHYCLLDPTTQYLQVRLHKYLFKKDNEIQVPL